MSRSVNEVVTDELIEHEVQVRRATSGTQRRVEARINQLGRDVKLAMTEIDPFSETDNRERIRKRTELQARVRELSKAAFQEISDMVGTDMARFAMLESDAVMDAVELSVS